MSGIQDTALSSPARRAWLAAGTGSALALTAWGSSGCQQSASMDRQLRLVSLADAEAELERLAAALPLDSSTAWPWAPTLEHCAQSIEFSMTGFPQPKPRLFQATVGAAAFAVFDWRSRMSHDLAEPIPGAPALQAGADPAVALARLRAAIAAFRAWSGPLKPHFAYGALDKPAYERAHAFHMANHFSAFWPKA